MTSTTSLPASVAPASRTPSATPQPHLPFGRLRAFVVALVVAHHAVLAYHPWAPPAPHALTDQPAWWQAFPVLDAQRWTGWAIFAAWNDIFFMALMFFLSGLFVWGSLERKGEGRFLRDRAVRLGIPFLVVAAAIAPLAYLPSYLLTTTTPSLSDYRHVWHALANWPAGPAWFIWLLLVFDSIAALVHRAAPGMVTASREFFARTLRSSGRSFAVLVALSTIAYALLVWRFGPLYWTTWGPFAFQTGRLLHYALYFTAGVIVGSRPFGETFLTTAALGRQWIGWAIAALGCFVVVLAVAIKLVGNPAPPLPLAVTGLVTFALSCAASSFALLALFLRYGDGAPGWLYGFCGAGYGVYLLHYPIVSWIQYALLRWPAGGFIKGVVVTVAALGLSFGLVAILRRSRLVAKVI